MLLLLARNVGEQKRVTPLMVFHRIKEKAKRSGEPFENDEQSKGCSRNEAAFWMDLFFTREMDDDGDQEEG